MKNTLVILNAFLILAAANSQAAIVYSQVVAPEQIY